ncbi:hypothetical protein PAXRUDRAFT_147263, partial [Paxillus rubicundulus Ve08.2h10]
LNPAVETHNIFDAMDKDIFKSVMDAKKLWERNGGDDDKNDNINVPAPSLTHSEILMLRKYVATFNDPFACKLKVMLGSFGQWTCVVEMRAWRTPNLLIISLINRFIVTAKPIVLNIVINEHKF